MAAITPSQARLLYAAYLQSQGGVGNAITETEEEKQRKKLASRVENAKIRGEFAGIKYALPSDLPQKLLSPLMGLNAPSADILGRAYERTYNTEAGKAIGDVVGPVLQPIVAGNPFAAVAMLPFMSPQEKANIDKAAKRNVDKNMQLKDTIGASEFQTKMGWSRPPSTEQGVGAVANRFARGVAGMAGEYLTDPLSWITFGVGGAAAKVGSEFAEGAAKAGSKALVKDIIEQSIDGVTSAAVKKELVRQGLKPLEADKLLNRTVRALNPAQERAVMKAATFAHPQATRLATQVPFEPTIRRVMGAAQGKGMQLGANLSQMSRVELPGGKMLRDVVSGVGEASKLSEIPRYLTTKGKNARIFGDISGGIVSEATRVKSGTDRRIMAEEAARILQKQNDLVSKGGRLSPRLLAKLDELNKSIGVGMAGAQVLPSANTADFVHVADIVSPEEHAAEVVRQAKESGFSSLTRQGDSPKSGWVLSPYRHVESVMTNMPNEAQTAAFINKHQSLLREPGHFVGLYQNDAGKWVLDVSVSVPKANASSDDIRRIARDWGQDELVDQDLASSGAEGFMVKSGFDRTDATQELSKKEWRKRARLHKQQAIQLLAGCTMTEDPWRAAQRAQGASGQGQMQMSFTAGGVQETPTSTIRRLNPLTGEWEAIPVGRQKGAISGPYTDQGYTIRTGTERPSGEAILPEQPLAETVSPVGIMSHDNGAATSQSFNLRSGVQRTLSDAPPPSAGGPGVPIKFKPMTKSQLPKIPTVMTSEGSIDLDRWENNIRNYMQQFPALAEDIRDTIGDDGVSAYIRQMREIMYENFGCALEIDRALGARSVAGEAKYGKSYIPGRLPGKQQAAVQRVIQEALTGQKTNDELVGELEDVYRRSLLGDFDVLKTGEIMAEKGKKYKTLAQRVKAGELSETNPIILAERRLAESKQLANRENMLTTMADATGVKVQKSSSGKWMSRGTDGKYHEVPAGFIIESHDGTAAWKMKTVEEAQRLKNLYETGGLHPKDTGLMRFFGSLASPLLTSMTVGRIGFTVTNALGNIDFIIRNRAASPMETLVALDLYNKLRKFGGDVAMFGDETMTVGGQRMRVQDFLAEALDDGSITPPQVFLEGITDPSHQNFLYRVPGIKSFLQANQAVNNVSENGSRLAVYYTQRNSGMQRKAARDVVDRVMLDYELSDLMPFEQELRKFVPFYTWSRRNIPATGRLAVERPGVFAAQLRIPRVLQENMKPEGCTSSYWDTYKQMPEFSRQQGMPFVGNLPGFGETAFNLRLPMADPMGQFYGSLAAARGNPQGALSDVVGGMLGPTIKTGAELLTGSRMGTGQTLSRYADAGTTWGDIGQFVAQSTPVLGPFYNAARNTPGVEVSLPGGLAFKGREEAKGGDPQALTRALLSNIGLYNKAWNPEANQRNWDYADAAALEAQLRRAKDTGTEVPTTKQVERKQATVRTIQGPPGVTGEQDKYGFIKWYRGDEYLTEFAPGKKATPAQIAKLMGVPTAADDTSRQEITFSDSPARGVPQTDGGVKWYVGDHYLGKSEPGKPMSNSLRQALVTAAATGAK